MSGGSQPISSSRPDDDQQVGLLQLQDEAGLRLDEVRVLVALAIDSTLTRSPPTSRASAARSSVVVTTLILERRLRRAPPAAAQQRERHAATWISNQWTIIECCSSP